MKEDVVRRIYQRLVETANVASGSGEDLCRELSLHFDRLPRSYLIGMCADNAEKVLLHRKVLADASANKHPVVNARFLTSFPVEAELYKGSYNAVQTLLPDLRADRVEEMFLHEITFACIFKPKLLSELSALVYGVGLHIREAHVFTTADGFSLSIFIVDGWYKEDANGLLEKIEKKISEKIPRKQMQQYNITIHS